MPNDATWMNEALNEGKKGFGTTSPNPPVGCVIVARGEIIGRGFHRKAGEWHAERMALADACKRGNETLLRESTVYVTLEPCSSSGRTPPCTEALEEARVARVVYGLRDPDSRHRGRADAVLSSCGIPCSLISDEEVQRACAHLARGFLMRVKEKRPWVIAKTAVTLDGRITRENERWLSCSESLEYAHILRLESDALLVGGETLRRDDPSLTIRCKSVPIPECKKQPWRVVMTRNRSSLQPASKLFTDEFSDRSIVVENAGDIRRDVLKPLYEEREVSVLLLECGGRLLRRWLAEGLVDEWVGIYTPWIAGGRDFSVGECDFLPQEWHLTPLPGQKKCLLCGDDVIIRGYLERSKRG